MTIKKIEKKLKYLKNLSIKNKKDIWSTEEYAAITFVSLEEIHINKTKNMPKKAQKIMTKVKAQFSRIMSIR